MNKLDGRGQNFQVIAVLEIVGLDDRMVVGITTLKAGDGSERGDLEHIKYAIVDVVVVVMRV